jgi:hypothetical protein
MSPTVNKTEKEAPKWKGEVRVKLAVIVVKTKNHHY